MKHIRKTIVCLLVVALLALAGCAQTPAATEAPKTDAPATAAQTEAQAPETAAAPEWESGYETPILPLDPTPISGPTELGTGDKLFYFDVTFSDGETSSYAIHTDAETVGEALVALELIAGDESEYGLYVKTIGGETLDWDVNGMYWAFYENGAYAMTGVDATPIAQGATYAFVATAG